MKNCERSIKNWEFKNRILILKLMRISNCSRHKLKWQNKISLNIFYKNRSKDKRTKKQLVWVWLQEMNKRSKILMKLINLRKLRRKKLLKRRNNKKMWFTLSQELIKKSKNLQLKMKSNKSRELNSNLRNRNLNKIYKSKLKHSIMSWKAWKRLNTIFKVT